ncbi:ABC transporter permease [uncultured Cohaesibacter sp.]|uniref:ABC transporter permease n=1 Tax=uncultured Cohaesibacter sp. TaxID=1002546 RepID=UPI00292F77CF|nr:ABC transporter permease [uncultured Cohaesibacter sp.]
MNITGFPLPRNLTRWQKQSLLFLLVFVLISLVSMVVPSYDTGLDSLEPPSLAHWLGTNDIGQDVLIGTLKATPNTVSIAIATSFLAIVLSIMLGATAAIAGGFVSNAILRLVDIIQVIPSILILLFLAALVHPSFWGTILLLALTTWHDEVRVLRALFLRELTRENVLYARRMGASWFYCATRHILPAVLPSVLGLFVQQIRQAAMKVAGLGFLGLTDPQLVTWGSLMQDALDHLQSPAWMWLLVPPGLCLSLFLLSVLFIGRGLEVYSMADGKEP